MLWLTGASVMAQTIPVLTFEVNEGVPLANPRAGANSATGLDGAVGGVGITQGTQAFIINDIPPLNDSTELSYEFSGSDVGEELQQLQRVQFSLQRNRGRQQRVFDL